MSTAIPAPDRAAINRANAQHSTGPTTETGRQRSSQNALTHGLTSRTPVLRSEDPAAYAQHCRQFLDEYQPQTPTEIQLVQELADTAWRLNRIPPLEAELLDIAARDMRRNGRLPSTVAQAVRALATLGQHSARLSRQFNKILTTLRQIQAERVQSLKTQDHPVETGFVFSLRGAFAPAHSDHARVNAMPIDSHPAEPFPSYSTMRRPARCKITSMKVRFFWAVFPFSALLWGQDGATTANWPSYGGTDFAWRYSALDQINTSNVKKLVPVWQFQTGDYAQGLQSTPIVIDGVLYLSTTHSQVFALDAVSGKMLWQYKYPMPRGAGGNIQNRGVAIGAGKVFVGTYDDYVVGIDQKTGVESWKVAIADSSQCGCSITGAPLLVKDKVVVGIAGGDGAFRGFLTALDAKTGRLAWRFYTIPGPGDKGNETWKGDSWKYGGGATWMTGSFDPALNMVYWGTGNAASDMYAGDRFSGQGEGANLYTGSIVALDADTGKLKWYYQEIPKDVWDYDSAYECLLIDRPVRGTMRKLLVHINKSGYAWVLDRTNGQFLGAYPIVDNHTWLTGMTEDGKILGRIEPVEDKPTLICPGPDGGKSWNQVAYSPRTALMYTPTLEICSDSVAREQTPVEGRGFLGGTWSHRAPANGPAYSHIDAYDPVTGKRVWSVRYKYALLASMLATAGDLLFTGDPEGNFFALNARTGEKLWSFQTGAGHRGSAISYSVNGRQYVATPTGWGSIAGRSLSSIWPEAENFRPGSTLMVFALPEDAK